MGTTIKSVSARIAIIFIYYVISSSLYLMYAFVSVYHSSQFRFSVAWKAEAERENRYVYYII